MRWQLDWAFYTLPRVGSYLCRQISVVPTTWPAYSSASIVDTVYCMIERQGLTVSSALYRVGFNEGPQLGRDSAMMARRCVCKYARSLWGAKWTWHYATGERWLDLEAPSPRCAPESHGWHRVVYSCSKQTHVPRAGLDPSATLFRVVGACLLFLPFLHTSHYDHPHGV